MSSRVIATLRRDGVRVGVWVDELPPPSLVPVLPVRGVRVRGCLCSGETDLEGDLEKERDLVLVFFLVFFLSAVSVSIRSMLV